MRISTAPEHADADVYIDGQYVGVVRESGQTSPTIQLAPGLHRVEVRKAGYYPYQDALRVPRKDAPKQMDIDVSLFAEP